MMIKIIITILSLLIATTAQASNLYEPSANDISVKMLGALFGKLVGSGQDPFLSAIETFNGACLVIGGILAAYTIVAGTMGTAHDGEVLGKQFSTMWLPIRYAVGTALVVPIGGYCLIQTLVMWLVLQGIGLADKVWDSFQSSPLLKQELVVNKSGTNSPISLAENLFSSYVCVLGNQKSVNDVSSATELIMRYKSKYDFGITQEGDNYYFGNKKNKSQLKQCGSVVLPSFQITKNEQQQPTNSTGVLGDIGISYTPVNTSSIIEAHRKATITLMSQVEGLASKSVDNYDKLDTKATYKELEEYAKQYEEVINSASQSFSKSYERQKSQNGWMEAGNIFNSIINDNNNINNAVSSVSSSNASVVEGADSWFIDAKSILDVAKQVLLLSTNNHNENITITEEGQSKKVESGSSLSGKIGAAIGKATTSIDLYQLKDDSRHPNIVANELGQKLLNFNLIVATSLAGLGLIAGSVASIFGSGVVAGITVFSSFLTLPFAGLWVIGFVCSYVIPFLPAIIFIGIIIGWLLLVVEAIIAAPLWAIAHLNPVGNDITGTAKAGYSLLLSLVLRPSLTIFGLIAAMLISQVVGEFINKVFFSLLANSQGGAIQGILAFVTILFGTAIYAFLIFTLNTKTFSLMYKLPDQILRWIGGSTGGLGEFAGDFESSSKQAIAGGTGAMLNDISRTPKGISSGLESVSRSLKNNKNENSKPKNEQQTTDNNNSSQESISTAQEERAFNNGRDVSSKFDVSESQYNDTVAHKMSEGMSRTEASKLAMNELSNQSIANKSSFLDTPQAEFLSKMSFKGNDEQGNPSYHLPNASKSLSILQKGNETLGQVRTSNIVSEVLSKNRENKLDDYREVSKAITSEIDRTTLKE